MTIFAADGVLPDPAVDSELRASDRHKPDWDFARALLPSLSASMLGTISLRQFCSRVPHQGDTKSCVAHAVTSALELCRRRDGLGHVDLSAAALWFATRQRMKPPVSNVDHGTSNWLALNTCRKLGVIPAGDWPWRTDNLHKNPGPLQWHRASANKISAHFRIGSNGDERVQHCIASLLAGHPVVFSTEIGSQWDDYDGGVIGHERRVRGNHAAVLIGWDGASFELVNSWGQVWGDKGFARIHPGVIGSSATRDLWTVVGGLA